MLMNHLDVYMQRNALYARYRRWWICKVVTQYFGQFRPELIGSRVLEIGCGAGHGGPIVSNYFRTRQVIATDLDPRLIAAAKRNARSASVVFEVADASALPWGESEFDAVFDFAAIHHIAEWRRCLAELCRVVRPGGMIFMVDSPIESFSTLLGRLARLYTSHPYEAMFSETELVQHLDSLGVKWVLKDIFRPNIPYLVLVVQR